MGWYRFEEGSFVGIPRIKNYHVAFYDMTHLNGDCFDESFYKPEDIALAITYVETEEDKNNSDRARVFVNFDDGDTYELRLIKLDKNKRYSNFYE